MLSTVRFVLLLFFASQLLALAVCEGPQIGGVEVMLLTYENREHRRMDGECCDWYGCKKDCRNYFSFCLWTGQNGSASDHWQAQCSRRRATKSFGDSKIFYKSRTSLGGKDPLKGPAVRNPLKWSFREAWAGSFNLSIKIADGSHFGALIADLKLLVPSAEPSRSWSTRLLKARYGKRLHLKWRVKCRSHYYGDCTTYCKQNDTDSGGHYKCNATDGSKICRKGWMGADCKERVPKRVPSPCKPKSCDNDTSVCIPATAANGSLFECKCRDGYRKQESRDSSCHRIICPPIIFTGPVNASYSDPLRTLGSVVTLDCLDGLVLIGTNAFVCAGNGTWAGKVPLCARDVGKTEPLVVGGHHTLIYAGCAAGGVTLSLLVIFAFLWRCRKGRRGSTESPQPQSPTNLQDKKESVVENDYGSIAPHEEADEDDMVPYAVPQAPPTRSENESDDTIEVVVTVFAPAPPPPPPPQNQSKDDAESIPTC